MAAVPIGKAQRGSENWRVGGVELRQQAEMRTGVGRDVAGRERGEMRDFVIQPEKQGRIADDRAPPQAAILVQRGSPIVPREQARLWVAGKLRYALRVSAERIRAVEAGASEKGVSQRISPAGQVRLRRRGGKALAGPLIRAGRSPATSHRLAADRWLSRGAGRA